MREEQRNENRRMVQLLQMIRGEFLEIPGLRLTRNQVQDLWGLDAEARDTILDTLTAAGFLKETGDGAFIRAQDG